MKLCTLLGNGIPSIGVGIDNGLVKVSDAAKSYGVYIPTSVHEVILQGTEALGKIQQVVERVLEGDDSEFVVAEENVTFGPAMMTPEKIICVGTNYRKHAIESNLPIPTTPVLFSKFNNALAAHRQVVQIPSTAHKVDYEVELVIVIGETAQCVPAENALDYVFGYTVGNDLSDRRLQFVTGQWLLGKTCDGFAPLGPYVATADEIKDPNDLNMETRVNGELRQSSNTRDMIFNCAELISYISQHMTLKPGDLIFTGTPEGVILGYPESQQRWLQPNDEIVVSIQSLGTLETKLR